MTSTDQVMRDLLPVLRERFGAVSPNDEAAVRAALASSPETTGLREAIDAMAFDLPDGDRAIRVGHVLALLAASPETCVLTRFGLTSHSHRCTADEDRLALLASPETTGPRLFLAVREFIREGIDAPGVREELHAAFYEARDRTAASPETTGLDEAIAKAVRDEGYEIVPYRGDTDDPDYRLHCQKVGEALAARLRKTGR